MIRLRDFVLFTSVLPSTARRSFRIDDSCHYAKHQSSTVTNAFEVSVKAREAFYPGGVGNPIYVPQMPHSWPPFAPRLAKDDLHTAESPEDKHAGLVPLPRASAALQSAPRVASSPVMIDDFWRDPAWQRDSILLLAFCGLEDLLRDAATGLKPQLGFDFLQLNAEISCAFLVAFSWVGAALLTGVLGDKRYDRGLVVLTWLLAAPAAAVVRVAVFSGFLCGSPDFAAFDAAAVLGLQLGIRLAEEQGFI